MQKVGQATSKQVIGILHGCHSFKMEQPSIWRVRTEEEVDVEKFLAKPPKKTVLCKRRYHQVKSLMKSEFGEKESPCQRIK
jgi:hypothetical protein